MNILFFIVSIVSSFIFFWFYIYITWINFYNPFKSKNSDKIIDHDDRYKQRNLIEFYTKRTVNLINLKYKLLWSISIAYFIIPISIPIIFIFSSNNMPIWIIVLMIVNWLLFEVVIMFFI
ncbi:hypothetical protein EI74_0417 [Mycoplasma testudineum]|uniref:Uncharacterized protein n=1 Tax=Mycoplasma testudineum TaxID=244584 RepID=A0A4R6IDJ6_9MOLU|nr:hypothetical protein CG473_01700 [Mycoplasma testudineum]TDO20340.1 hypothetical protein EI74_0417 [Mycoplasma testudineum]